MVWVGLGWFGWIDCWRRSIGVSIGRCGYMYKAEQSRVGVILFARHPRGGCGRKGKRKKGEREARKKERKKGEERF